MGMAQDYHRDRSTWLLYLLLGYYAFFINVFGPITPYLKDELALSYTMSSLLFTAFAVGILLAGLGGHIVVQRVGRWPALWLGAFGMSGGVLLLLVGRTPMFTIGASFCMGLLGSLILVIVPSTLSDLHREFRAIALSEANLASSLISTSAPLLVGWLAPLPDGWRLVLATAAFAPFLLRIGFRRVTLPPSTSCQGDAPTARRSLPSLFWVFWVGLVLAVSAEFCMIYWSANYFESSLRMPKANAAQSVSIFLAAMIVGRLAGSRLVQRVSPRRVIIVSVLVGGIGFLLFWTANAAILGLAGLFVTGLGVANLYPLLLSLAMGVASDNAVQASARTTLASGTAILALPLVLGRLADMAGIRPAYGIVGILFIGIFLIMLVTAPRRARTDPVQS